MNNNEAVRVVIVDDDEDARMTLKMLLDCDGYTTFAAASAVDALALVQSEDPHGVIVDLFMPQMNGAEFVRHLRAQHGKHTIVIAVTGSLDPRDHDAAREAGADYVMVKPLDPKVLQHLLPRPSKPATPPRNVAPRLALRIPMPALA